MSQASENKVAWPHDFFKENLRRAKILEAAKGNLRAQTALMRYYGNPNHCVEWVQDFCVTFDPRIARKKKVIPFIPFKKQADFLEYLVELWKTKESGLTEKCRDIGATWLCCAFSTWLWIFHPDSTIGWGSRKEEYVDDKNNPKAIFPKIRQLIDNLPFWMQPLGYNPNKHATYMKIINPANGASITGEAGDNIGRGGRTTIFMKDESAHYERPELIEAALGDNTDVQVDISSVNGSANVFYRRRMAGEVWTPNHKIAHGKTRVFIFDWRDHPGKSQEWYDARRAKAEAEGLLHIFAQEVDRDYSGAVMGVIIKAEWARAALDADKILAARLPEDQREAYLASWRSGDRMAGQDIADGGIDLNACVGRHGSVVTIAQKWPGEAGPAARVSVPLCVDNHFIELYYDSIGVGSGFKSEINTMKEEHDGKNWPQFLRVMKWNATDKPLDPEDPVISGDPESPTNEDVYENLKAQGAFRLRSRFYKTYEAIFNNKIYDPSEMICIPSDLENAHQLIMEISQPVKKTSERTGKTIVDKKPDGAMSPNLWDALNMCFNPTRETSILDVL